MTISLRATAVHEVGHWAVSRAFGVKVLRVTVVTSPGRSGAVEFCEPEDLRELELLAASASANEGGARDLRRVDSAAVALAISVAGACAEQVAGYQPPREWSEGSDVDQEEEAAAEIAEAVGAPPDWAHYFRFQVAESVRSYLMQRWGLIDQLAKKLLEQGTLSGDQMDALIDPKRLLPAPDLDPVRNKARFLLRRYGARRVSCPP